MNEHFVCSFYADDDSCNVVVDLNRFNRSDLLYLVIESAKTLRGLQLWSAVWGQPSKHKPLEEEDLIG